MFHTLATRTLSFRKPSGETRTVEKTTFSVDRRRMTNEPMTKEFPMTNAEFSLITRASGGESRGLPSRRQRSFHRLATLCWERIGHWGYWSFTGHCGIGHWSFAPHANPLEMSRNRNFPF